MSGVSAATHARQRSQRTRREKQMYAYVYVCRADVALGMKNPTEHDYLSCKPEGEKVFSNTKLETLQSFFCLLWTLDVSLTDEVMDHQHYRRSIVTPHLQHFLKGDAIAPICSPETSRNSSSRPGSWTSHCHPRVAESCRSCCRGCSSCEDA